MKTIVTLSIGSLLLGVTACSGSDRASEDTGMALSPIYGVKVTTGSATEIGQIHARLGVTTKGLSSNEECGVCWGPEGSGANFVTQTTNGVRCMRQIPCLNVNYFTNDGYMDPAAYTPGTTYDYKAYAIRGTQKGYGKVEHFTVPLVTTGDATDVGQSQAHLGVNVTGLRTGDECGVCWGPTGTSLDYTTELSPQRVRCMRQTPCLNATYYTSDGYMAQSEYSPGETYDYRGYVYNDAGIAYGPTKSFSVPVQPDTAVSKKLCFYLRTTYTDSNHGEDYWSTSSSDVPAAGFHWVLSLLGRGFIEGDTDSFGCSETEAMQSGSRTVYLQSYASTPTGDRVTETLKTDSAWGQTSRSVAISNSGSNQYFFITPPDGEDQLALNVHAVFARSLFAIPGTITEGRLQAALTTTEDTGYDWSNTRRVKINVNRDSYGNSHAEKKFIIAHETGHMVLRRSVANLPNNDRTYNVTSGPTAAYCGFNGPEQHCLYSQEYQGSSLHEGFADFFAAAIFNYGGVNADCLVTFGSQDGLDCDIGTNSSTNHNIVQAYMKNRCTGLTGKGVETDWLRTFWNVYTGVDASSSTVSASAMIDWINRASSIGSSWTPNGDNAFLLLDAAADQIGGALNANWDSAKVTNGINY